MHGPFKEMVAMNNELRPKCDNISYYAKLHVNKETKMYNHIASHFSLLGNVKE